MNYPDYKPEWLPTNVYYPQWYQCKHLECWVRSWNDKWKCYPQARWPEPDLSLPTGFVRWDIAMNFGSDVIQTHRSKAICKWHDRLLIELWDLETREGIMTDDATHEWAVRNGGRI